MLDRFTGSPYPGHVGLQVLEVAKGEGKAERQRDVLWKINAEVHEENGTLDHGIRLVDGDGTVRQPPACTAPGWQYRTVLPGI